MPYLELYVTILTFSLVNAAALALRHPDVDAQ